LLKNGKDLKTTSRQKFFFPASENQAWEQAMFFHASAIM
jgi:hypothetical protein